MGRGEVWQGEWCAWGEISARIGRDQGEEILKTRVKMGGKVGESAGKNKSKDYGRREAGLTGHGRSRKKKKRVKERGRRRKGKFSKYFMISTTFAFAQLINAMHIRAGTGEQGLQGSSWIQPTFTGPCLPWNSIPRAGDFVPTGLWPEKPN